MDHVRRSRNVLTRLVVLALLLCAQSALGQTRPRLSEVFQSPVTIQITTGTDDAAETVKGKGEVTANGSQVNEFYTFKGSSNLEIISRYDLGEIFTISPPRCDVEEVEDTDPPFVSFFGWVANAKMGGADEVNGITGTTWVSTGTLPAPTRVLLATNEGDTPLYYEERTPERTVRIIFLDYQTTFKQKPNLFKPPRHCPK